MFTASEHAKQQCLWLLACLQAGAATLLPYCPSSDQTAGRCLRNPPLNPHASFFHKAEKHSQRAAAGACIPSSDHEAQAADSDRSSPPRTAKLNSFVTNAPPFAHTVQPLTQHQPTYKQQSKHLVRAKTAKTDTMVHHAWCYTLWQFAHKGQTVPVSAARKRQQDVSSY